LEPSSNESKLNAEVVKAVGFGNPPEATRFRKGVSGNPKGRPKGSLNVYSMFIKTLRAKVVIKENGRRKTVTKLEAALKQVANKAASGEMAAFREVFAFAQVVEAKQNTSVAQNPAIEELDREVIDGIVQRLNAREEDIRELQEDTREGNDVDDQHG
jgi:Family of unknown function (DUF5681)